MIMIFGYFNSYSTYSCTRMVLLLGHLVITSKYWFFIVREHVSNFTICSHCNLYLQDQKKLQGQLIAEQEALYGSKPSPSKPQSVKKAPRMSTGGAGNNRRLSLGGTMLQTPKLDPSKATPHSRPGRKSDRVHHTDQLNCNPDEGFTASSTGKSSSLNFNSMIRKYHFY